VRPVSPRRSLLLAVILLAAFGAGGALAYALDQLYPVFGSSSTLTRISGVPVLGCVAPAFPKRSARRALRDGGLMVAVAACLLAGFAIALILSHEGYRVTVAA